MDCALQKYYIHLEYCAKFTKLTGANVYHQIHLIFINIRVAIRHITHKANIIFIRYM